MTSDWNDCWNRIGVRGDRTCPELTKVVHCHNCPVFSAAGQQLFSRPLPADRLAERIWDGGGASEAKPAETVSLIVFRVGAEWLALDVRRMIEVAESRVVRRIPHRREHMLRGLVNVRGELHLCISLADLLEVADTSADGGSSARSGWLLMAEHNQQRWALAVDEVLGVHRIERDRLAPIPMTVAHGRQTFSRSLFVLEEKRVGVVDAERLFGALESMR